MIFKAILVAASLFITSNTAQSQVQGLVVNRDKLPVSDVRITATGSNGDYSDQNGYFSLRFIDEIKPGQQIQLNIKSNEWHLLYPVNGQLTIPISGQSDPIIIVVTNEPDENLDQAFFDHEFNSLSTNIRQLFDRNQDQIMAQQQTLVNINQGIEQVLQNLEDKPDTLSSHAKFLLGKRAFINRDVPSALNWWREATEEGHSNAQCALGTYYVKDDQNADYCIRGIHLLEKSAEQGNPQAQMNLAIFHWEGNCVIKNLNYTRDTLSMLAEQGYIRAIYNLGVFHLDQKEIASAINCFEQISTIPHAEALYQLAVIYSENHRKEGIMRNRDLSLQLMQKSAEAGCVEAINYLNDLRN